MTTEAAKPMFEHFVPETEPPIGTFASFHYSFASGGGSSSGFLMHSPSGWSDSVNPQPHNTRTWESLTDLEARNAEIQRRNPGSTAVFTTVDVRIHAVPPVGLASDHVRLAELENAVYSAAQRAGIQTEGTTAAELVYVLANLVYMAGKI
jgi:hypothetical protein